MRCAGNDDAANQVRALEAQGDEDRKNAAREIATLAAQLQNARETNRALTDANRSFMQGKGAEDAAIKSQIEQLNARIKSAQDESDRSRAEQLRLAADLETRNRELEAARAAARDRSRSATASRGR